jgi:hypothetical protein
MNKYKFTENLNFSPVAQLSLANSCLLFIEAWISLLLVTSQAVGAFRMAISPKQRALLENTQPPKETDIHVPGGIWTHTPSKRAAADLDLRTSSHRDGQTSNNMKRH